MLHLLALILNISTMEHWQGSNGKNNKRCSILYLQILLFFLELKTKYDNGGDTRCIEMHSRFYHPRKLSHRSRTDCRICSMAQKLLAKQLCPEFQQGSGPKRNYYRLHYQGNICPRYSNSPQVPYKEKGEGFQGQTGIQKQSWLTKKWPTFPSWQENYSFHSGFLVSWSL